MGNIQGEFGDIKLKIYSAQFSLAGTLAELYNSIKQTYESTYLWYIFAKI